MGERVHFCNILMDLAAAFAPQLKLGGLHMAAALCYKLMLVRTGTFHA
jgi:hypothetical protein